MHYFLRRIVNGDNLLWIIAGKSIEDESNVEIYYVNADLGALARPPAAAWILGQHGKMPCPSIKVRDVTFDKSATGEAIVRRMSTRDSKE